MYSSQRPPDLRVIRNRLKSLLWNCFWNRLLTTAVFELRFHFAHSRYRNSQKCWFVVISTVKPAWLSTQAVPVPAQVSCAPPQMPHLFSLCSWCGLLVPPWPSLMSTDLSGGPWTGLTLVTRPNPFTFLGDCGAVSHHWQGLFNAYLIHLPFGITHNGFEFYNFLLFKLHYISLEVGSNIHFQPSFFFLTQQAFLSSRCDEKACFHYYFLF